MAYQDILKILDPSKFCSSVQNFIDIYFKLPGIPINGQLTESDCIRVRICEGRFALLIREVCSKTYCLQLWHSILCKCSNLILNFFWIMFASLLKKEISSFNLKWILILALVPLLAFLTLGKLCIPCIKSLNYYLLQTKIFKTTCQ